MIGLSRFGVGRLLFCVLGGLCVLAWFGEALGFLVYVPVIGLVYAFEFFGTLKEPFRDDVLETRLWHLLTDLGVPHSWLCVLFGPLPPLHRVKGWKTRRRIYGP